MKSWKKNVFKRDKYTCKMCGEKGEINAHHIKSFCDIMLNNNINIMKDARNCNEMWNVDNGITLCKECHLWIHNLNPLNFQ